MKEAPIKLPMYDGQAMAKPWREWFTDLFIATKAVRLPARNVAPSPARGEAVIWYDELGYLRVSAQDLSGVVKSTVLLDFNTL